jgi:hypothetical protein
MYSQFLQQQAIPNLTQTIVEKLKAIGENRTLFITSKIILAAFKKVVVSQLSEKAHTRRG